MGLEKPVISVASNTTAPEVKVNLFKPSGYGPTFTLGGYDKLPDHLYIFPISSNVGLWTDAFISGYYEDGILTITYAKNSSGSFYANGTTTGSLTYENGNLTINLTKSIVGNSNDFKFKIISW